MTVGVVLSKTTVDQNMTDFATQVIALFAKQEQLQQWNATTAQADLVTLGFTTDEAFLIKTVCDRMQQAHVWLDGGTAPPDTHDTLADLAKFVGMGVGIG